MRYMEISKLQRLLDLLRQQGELHSPVLGDDGVTRFELLPPGKLPDLAAIRTQLPPKKYLLHPQETILTYQADAGYRVPLATVPAMILFGLHPCDLAGISYLDRIFLGDEPDQLYLSRRAALTLIGVSCTPDEFCSCRLYPSPLEAWYDLFFQQSVDGIAVSIGSPRGAELMKILDDVMEERELLLPEDTRCFFGRKIPLPPESELDQGLPEWQVLAGHCIGCGACSVCCPTCSCFDVLEFGGLDGSSAERLRRWDNCLFRSHAEVAGGMSFQKDRAQRFRYRYRHKYRGFGQVKGVPGCTGCGRCRAFCPAGLDLRALAGKLEGDAS